MDKKVMNRKASDNEYLHKDFHGAMSCAIEYLHKNYGEEAVREYLKKFTGEFYAPLIKDLKERGLIALKEHFERIYAIEGGDVEISLKGNDLNKLNEPNDLNEPYELNKLNDLNELIINVRKCPAVTYMHENNRPVAALFYETTRTVNEVLCEGTPFKAEFLDYNDITGGNIQKFTGRDA